MLIAQQFINHNATARIWKLPSRRSLGHLRFLLAISCLLMTSVGPICGVAWGDERLAYDPTNRDDEIRKLINQLDDRSFSNREAASLKLADIGAPALRALAITVFKGSPESAWRTKKAIELIGTHGNEDVFLKSMGILQILIQADSESLDEKFVQLQLQWKLEQKKVLIAKLRELGAKVLDPQENLNAADAGLQGRFIGIRRVNPIPAADRSSTIVSSPRHTGAVRQINLDIDEATKQIDRILLATLEENRKLVLGNKPKESETLKLTKDSDADEILQFQLQQAVLRQRARQTRTAENGIVVSLDEQWQGIAEDIEKLNDLHGLSKIELLNFHPGRKQLDALSHVETATIINVAGDQIPDKDFVALKTIPNLTKLELLDRTVSGRLLSGFADVDSLSSISFTKCELPVVATRKLQLLKGIRSLFLEEMQIGEDLFQAMARMDDVKTINLSICKFNTSDYQELISARPNLRITYTPQAFLGVRGMAVGNVRECQITQVVPDSGAEKGGILVGDVIMKIDGQPIEKFEDLRLHIAQHKAGESLEVQVRRDTKIVNLTVVLGSSKNNLK